MKKSYSKQTHISVPITLTLPFTSIKEGLSDEKIELSLKSSKVTKPNTNNYIIHRAFITQRYNERRGTAKTLTRAEVRGGGRKPWRQKGTGRARAGSNRSPLWRGGGVSFGPQPKIYKHKINRKEWQLGLRSLLINKKDQIIIFNDKELTSTLLKTSELKKKLHQLEIDISQKIVIITSENNEALAKITRNIKTIQILNANNLNLKEILYSKRLLMTLEGLRIIEQIYNL